MFVPSAIVHFDEIIYVYCALMTAEYACRNQLRSNERPDYFLGRNAVH